MSKLVCPKCGRIAMDSVVQVMRNEKGTTRYRVFRHPRVKQKAGVKHVKRCYVKMSDFGIDETSGLLEKAASEKGLTKSIPSKGVEKVRFELWKEKYEKSISNRDT